MINITYRQAQALAIAEMFGNARRLKSTSPHSGSFKRMFTGLISRGLITQTGALTTKGKQALDEWEALHPRTTLVASATKR